MSNNSVTVYAAAKYGVINDLEDIYQRDCSLVGRYHVLMHLGINVISTLLLSSSNYCAQISMASIRSEVDMAHNRGDWLGIGVSSLSHFVEEKNFTKA